jgi:phage-related protein
MATVSTENLLLSLQVDANQALTTLKKVDTQTKQTQQTFTNVGKANRNFGASFQNAGYQIQDFAVQVGSGTDAVRAFSQQAPQLLSAFGGIGIAAGTAIAVLAPLVKSLFQSGEAAESATDSLDSFRK